MKRFFLLLIIPVFILVLLGKNLDGTSTTEMNNYRKATATLAPNTDYKTHTVGQLYFTVSNWGVFGSQRGENDSRLCDPFYMKDEDDFCGISSGQCIPSGEYPGCSRSEYLFQGCLWIGAVVDGDTLVSVGEDGWFHNQEMFPARSEDALIRIRSIHDDPRDEFAVSEQDFICEYTDTAVDPAFVDVNHRPIGISVRQESYSWSYNYARNFIGIKYVIKNIRSDRRPIEDMYIGIYVDCDVGNCVGVNDYAQDDVNGFIRTYTDYSSGSPVEVPLNLAWLADNDGDPNSEFRYDTLSVTGVSAVKVHISPDNCEL
jgi:hypothetical protein